MPGLDQDIADYAMRLFLRYFRGGAHPAVAAPALDLARDVELLAGHWSISVPVRRFLDYMLKHRHEAQSLLQFVRRTDDAMARGRIDARATVLARAVAGHPSLVVAEEPLRSFNTGPNQLVAWVVHQSALHGAKLLSLQSPVSAYRTLIEAAMAQVAAVKRLDALREPLKHVASNRRPGPGALRDASRSRRALYREAVAAYRALAGVEAGDPAALREVLGTTVIAPLEDWRRYELAVAMGVGMALAEETDAALHLSLLRAGTGEPILRCGRFSLYWQQRTLLFRPPPLEPSEERLKRALASYDMGLSADRPDLVLIDEVVGQVAAVIEVKYLLGDTASVRFREAVEQVVRYARGYADDSAGIDRLIGRSLVALSAQAPPLVETGGNCPHAVDFDGIRTSALNCWVRACVLPSSH